MQKTAKILISAALGLFLTSTATPASAGTDDKSYHASVCQEVGSGESGAFNRSRYRVTRSGSGGSGQLICPVVRDNFSGGGIFGFVPILYAEVNVLDKHYTNNITCSLVSETFTGSVYSYTSASTEGSSNYRKKLNINGAYPLQGFAYLLCSLPRNDSNGYTKLYSYKIRETND